MSFVFIKFILDKTSVGKPNIYFTEHDQNKYCHQQVKNYNFVYALR